jgi:hypothetical protein
LAKIREGKQAVSKCSFGIIIDANHTVRVPSQTMIGLKYFTDADVIYTGSFTDADWLIIIYDFFVSIIPVPKHMLIG